MHEIRQIARDGHTIDRPPDFIRIRDGHFRHVEQSPKRSGYLRTGQAIARFEKPTRFEKDSERDENTLVENGARSRGLVRIIKDKQPNDQIRIDCFHQSPRIPLFAHSSSIVWFISSIVIGGPS